MIDTEQLRRSLHMHLASFDADELAEIDPEFVRILNERHNWAKHPADRLWHSVLEYGHGSVVTRCRGRWALTEPYETKGRPPWNERCEACQHAYAEASGDRVEAGLLELSNATVQVADRFDLGGEG